MQRAPENETLKELIEASGSLAPGTAARIAISILSELVTQHKESKLHGNVQPAYVILCNRHDARLITPPTEPIDTSPYTAPEVLAGNAMHRGAEQFSVGMMLLEMITATPPTADTSVETVLKMQGAADVALVNVILKATSPQPEQRYPDAASMRDALLQYLNATQTEPEGAGSGTHSTLEFLLRRMRSKSDFPALSGIISEINKCISSDSENTGRMAQVILQDFALTNKIIKLVNTVTYRRFGGNINTISKAVGILGFDAIRNIAMTLILLDFLQNKTQAQDLKDEVISSFFAGLIAAQLSAGSRAGVAEEAMICAMFHHLGRMLAKFYFFEESQEVTRLMQDQGMDEPHASVKVLGLSYNDLGVGVAESWGFPARLITGMKKIPGNIIKKPGNDIDQLQLTVNLANELCEIAFHSEKSEKNTTLRKLTARYAAASPPTDAQLSQTLEAGMMELSNRASIIGINVTQSPLLKKVQQWCGHPHAESETNADIETEESTSAEEEKYNLNAETILNAGIQDVIGTLADDDYKLNDILQMVLETIFRGLNFQHALVLIRDNKKDQMTARFGFGEDINNIVSRFHFPLAFAADVFHVAIEKGLDIIIEDVTASNITSKIPAWYRQAITAQSFLLLPIMINKKAIGLIYADTLRANSLKITDKQLALLRTLRNQAVIAIKQKT